ncbi:ketopantoate reductase ApbA/PanE domain-containing protein (plasmid) [Rhizobium etli]|uniref:2-dehydropantoate 2-reductase n=1 Tax=Rhizobium etli TaxID=29449 RepID=A0AAN1ENT4_RHIET|nr:2-dehydropantoate 2-reductase N-terminal domain-containing protein [Rhizobium etli]AGS25966.1 ketopantoate reductase ApbA/PanE domain-containing protein [Rhizobium etli bv. mimosae str. Mim1]ARQ14307.1 ketopantoate reductase ApbA/PanE domain-containing protein [Rhizobium etli]
MTRYIVIGAGAVGASLAAEFQSNGIAYVLVGRGAQIAHIAAHGLSYRRPGGHRVLRLNTADTATPPALRAGDILVLAVKAQDVEAATEFWAWREVEGSGFASELPLVTLQNGLAAEDIALRRFNRVYAASIRIPARYTVTGEVVVGGEPNVGIVALGRYPEGLDDTASSIVEDLSKAGYLAEARPDIRRWKAAKLEHNVTNAVELFAGPAEIRSKAAASLAKEARAVLVAAGYELAAPSEWKIDISSWRVAPESGIEPGQQSTWQSFTRGATSEVDYLNGEIVRLARIHGIAAPLNAAFQRAAARLALEGRQPGTRDIVEIYGEAAG